MSTELAIFTYGFFTIVAFLLFWRLLQRGGI